MTKNGVQHMTKVKKTTPSTLVAFCSLLTWVEEPKYLIICGGSLLSSTPEADCVLMPSLLMILLALLIGMVALLLLLASLAGSPLVACGTLKVIPSLVSSSSCSCSCCLSSWAHLDLSSSLRFSGSSLRLACTMSLGGLICLQLTHLFDDSLSCLCC